MTPLGHGILTGMPEVSDPVIRGAMDKMLSAAPRAEVNQTVLDLSTLCVALCNALADCSDTSPAEVLNCLLAL